MPKFVVRAGLEVDAVRWNGWMDNAAVKEMCGEACNISCPQLPTVRTWMSTNSFLTTGIWVVKHGEWDFRLYTDKTFTTLFETAAEPQWQTVCGRMSGAECQAFRWDGLAHTANRLLGDRFKIDWEYERAGSSGITYKGELISFGQWIVRRPGGVVRVMGDRLYHAAYTATPPATGQCAAESSAGPLEKPVVAAGCDGYWASTEPPVIMSNGFTVEGVWLSNAQFDALTAAAGPGKVVEYQTVQSDSSGGLSKWVGEYLDDGWEPQGGATLWAGRWVQAMVRRETRAGTAEKATWVTDDMDAGMPAGEAKREQPVGHEFSRTGPFWQQSMAGEWREIPSGPQPDRRTEVVQIFAWLKSLQGDEGGWWIQEFAIHQQIGCPNRVAIKFNPDDTKRMTAVKRVVLATAKALFPHVTFEVVHSALSTFADKR